MRVVEIRAESEFEGLLPAWEGLLRESASNTIFLTAEWMRAWWSAYGTPGDLRVLAAFDEGGVLRGIAPLRRQSQRKYGQTVELYSFIGDGSNDSEYLNCILASGYEEAVMQGFRAHWEQELERGVIFSLREIPTASANLAWFEGFAATEGLISNRSEIPCGTVKLPDSWDAYVGCLKPRFRTKVRSVLRDMECRAEVRFGFCQTAAEVERLLPVLYELHERRWKKDGMPGVFGWDRKRDFYSVLSPLLLERDWLRFSWLEWTGRILACQYGFAYNGTYFHLQEGYEPASEHLSIGVGLRAWSVRELLKEGIREYDFLGGMGRHKSDWGAEEKHSSNLQIARANYKTRLFCQGPKWEELARESVKKMIPDRILSARQAHLKAPAENTGTTKPSLLELSRNSVASCYFHLRLPALARPVRDMYQVSTLSSGKRPRLSWTRRQEPSARILYYHRVNDDGDPFFPAISTKLFEEEMRYIARHYQVVSLGEVLNHLDTGSTKPVLAITFDDGYQDNYQNAFPVLRRYGLPATIFLTTGSLDSRQPLWFEQLAQAIKLTTRKHIDLDIDIPRRFRLESTAERLAANSEIFALLRLLTDAQRGEWLDRVLKELAVHDGGRSGMMLAWDQVREMKKQAIDFGGHTVTHPFLSKVTREQAAWEVGECKRRIEDELQLPAAFFAYPNGRDEDFGDWNKTLLRDAGYQAALTTKWGLNYRSTDRMELRRGGPWEETPALFAYKLDWYQLVND